VSICSKANLGVSMIAAPAFIVFEAIENLWSGFSVGMVEYLIQGLLLVVLCIILRKFNYKFLFAFLVAIIYGFVLDLFLFIFKDITISYVWLRWVMLIVGDVITAFGVACYFRTYMPLQVYELFVSRVSSNFKLSINKVKWSFDISLLIISLILSLTLFGDINTFDFSTILYSSFHSIGLGTIVTTFINSPIIKMMGNLIDRFFDSGARFSILKDYFEK
jgi:uncharacterized membrane protein YczE